MAKIRHNNFIDTLSELANKAAGKGVIQLYTEDESFSGREIIIHGKKVCHFGTTGYLGLEQDERLKRAAIDAILKYGTQFPLSKTYISYPLYKDLEEKLERMYGVPIIVTKNSTLGHLGVIPSVVRDEDGVIFDHQVHWSVQQTGQILKSRGAVVEMIRHNDMNMLEDKIRGLSSRCSKVWYFADGIYSMFGDVAPIAELKELMGRYPQLHLYFDDVHGQSWIGKHGTGFVFNEFDPLPHNVIVFSTLSKSFGASGGIMITSNPDYYQKVKSFGGPLTFSAQLEPASVGAAAMSATIHLTDEIYSLQKELEDKIEYCNELLAKTDLPLVEKNDCPVFYIGAGAPAIGYRFINKLLSAGFYVNMGLFPAVPVKKTGARFTISRHNRYEDIDRLVKAMAEHFPRALEEESYSNNMVRRIFHLPGLDQSVKLKQRHKEGLTLSLYRSIKEIDQHLWNSLMGGKSVYDYGGLQFLERAFSGDKNNANDWQFFYILVRDQYDKPVLATFLTFTLWKDDMLAPASVSIELESRRKEDPYYLSSKVLSIGSLFTEGEQLYLDRSHPEWQLALNMLLVKIEALDGELSPSMTVLRDFEDHDDVFRDEVLRNGFIKIDLPESCILESLDWENEATYLNTLSARSRKHFRKDIAPYIPCFNVTIQDRAATDEIRYFYDLYLNVWKKNFDLNTFSFPMNVITRISEDPNWEFIVLSLKDEYREGTEDAPVAVMFCYKNMGVSYVPAYIGLDYVYTTRYGTYRQMLYQTVLRARELGFEKIDFGLSASFEKKKIGATIIPKVAYVQAKDNYVMEMLGVMQKA